MKDKLAYNVLLNYNKSTENRFIGKQENTRHKQNAEIYS